MKCHILFSEKNKKNISKCLLKILPRVLSVNSTGFQFLTTYHFNIEIGHTYLDYFHKIS